MRQAAKSSLPETRSNGLIDDLQLYSVALDAEHVAALASGSDGRVPFVFTHITRAGDGSSATLTWNSRPGRLYVLDYSTDLVTWIEIDDGYPSGGDSTTFIDSFIAPLNPDTLYFRVGEY